MQAPNEAILDWLAAQPDEVVTDASALISAMVVPDGEAILGSGVPELVNAFRDWLQSPTSAFRQIGAALTFKSCFDYIIANRSSEADWAITTKVMQEVADKFPDSRDKWDKMIAAIPDRARIWIETARSWREFSDTHLSREYLERYSRERNTQYAVSRMAK